MSLHWHRVLRSTTSLALFFLIPLHLTFSLAYTNLPSYLLDAQRKREHSLDCEDYAVQFSEVRRLPDYLARIDKPMSPGCFYHKIFSCKRPRGFSLNSSCALLGRSGKTNWGYLPFLPLPHIIEAGA